MVPRHLRCLIYKFCIPIQWLTISPTKNPLFLPLLICGLLLENEDSYDFHYSSVSNHGNGTSSSGENATVVAGTGPAGWAQVEPRGPQIWINIYVIYFWVQHLRFYNFICICYYMYNKYVTYYNTYIYIHNYIVYFGLQLGLFFRTDAYRDVIFQRQGGLAHSGSCLLLHALWRWKAWNSWSITQWIGWNCTAASKDLQSLLPKRLKNRLKDVSIHQVRSKSSHGFDLAPWCWTRCTMHNEMMAMTTQTIWTSTPQRNTENKSKRKLNSKPYSRNKTSAKTIQPMKARKIFRQWKLWSEFRVEKQL